MQYEKSNGKIINVTFVTQTRKFQSWYNGKSRVELKECAIIGEIVLFFFLYFLYTPSECNSFQNERKTIVLTSYIYITK